MRRDLGNAMQRANEPQSAQHAAARPSADAQRASGAAAAAAAPIDNGGATGLAEGSVSFADALADRFARLGWPWQSHSIKRRPFCAAECPPSQQCRRGH